MPRLGEAAIRLALWLLSLPEGADVSLSEAARRAGIKPSAFRTAKRQLREERYFHEWRMQGRGGRWTTRQLISNVPLTPEQALAVRDGKSPTAVKPAVGEPGGSAGRSSPGKDGAFAAGLHTQAPVPVDTQVGPVLHALRGEPGGDLVVVPVPHRLDPDPSVDELQRHRLARGFLGDELELLRSHLRARGRHVAQCPASAVAAVGRL
ncbi:hypothetical protein [Streptomyces morookaense]|uniref:Uncharacterized protein n=1 Tax=Streptomyces morookaense TaxID=1970 RepID=A0A7Y7E705_STRMO|nr:hypothetical protein [Streptomyces morookaense]NVK78465.1 hypothetical protein [Streptomyces morookaense]